MNLSKKFEELIIKQLESFGCSMGVTNLVMYLASAKQGTKASFEMIGQWPQIDRLLTSIAVSYTHLTLPTIKRV